MPISETTARKISLIVFIALAVIGALFMVFAFFFNKGTLTVNSTAPYLLSVGNIKTQACADNSCSVVLAPGDYDITLKKAGYRDIEKKVTVPIAGEAKENITFEFITTLLIRGDESAAKLFSLPAVSAPDLPSEGIFYEKNYLAYIARDQESHRQTLYIRTIADGGTGSPVSGGSPGKAGEKKAVTSFVRDLKDYLIIPAVEERNKIALIDSTAGTSTLYMIDLTKKSRDSIFTYPLISDVKWLPGTDDFLFEAREEGQVSSSVFIYRSGTAQTQKLDLQTSLKNVVAVSKDRLVAATNQFIAEPEKLGGLEGTLVALGEPATTVLTEGEATPAVTSLLPGLAQAASTLSFVDYSLISGDARLLKNAPDLASPSQARLSETGKSVYFLIDGKDYELQFTDEAI